MNEAVIKVNFKEHRNLDSDIFTIIGGSGKFIFSDFDSALNFFKFMNQKHEKVTMLKGNILFIEQINYKLINKVSI